MEYSEEVGKEVDEQLEEFVTRWQDEAKRSLNVVIKMGTMHEQIIDDEL